MKLAFSNFSYLSSKSLILISYFPKIENLKSYLSLSLNTFIDHIKKFYGIDIESNDLDEILEFDWRNTINSFERVLRETQLFKYFEIEKEYEKVKEDLFEKEYEKIRKEMYLLNFSNFFKDFIKLKIDLFNTLSFLKHKYFELPFRFINGGNLNERVFKTFEKANLSEFIEFINSRYPKFIEKSFEDIFSLFEKKRDEVLIKYLKSSKFYVFGPEIVFSYLVLKNINYINLRLIYNGIIYSLPHEEVIRRLRVING